MVVPFRHTADLSDLDGKDQAELIRLLSLSQTVIGSG